MSTTAPPPQTPSTLQRRARLRNHFAKSKEGRAGKADTVKVKKRIEMKNLIYDLSGNLLTTTSNIVGPTITSQPLQVIAAPGEIASFSVVVGDPAGVTFQWKFNNADIPGATGDSLLLTGIGIANEGQYSVVVTNGAGSITSTAVALLLDSDRDGLPDAWEAANFIDADPTHPLNPANQRSETDSDKDGVSNLDEFLEGTDPISSFSMRPRLIVHSGAGGSVTVTPRKLSYDLGESVTLTPLPDLPTGIVSWSGDLSGTDNPAIVKMDRHKTVRASFAVPLPPGLIAAWRGETNAGDLIGGHHGAFFAGTAVTVSKIIDSGKVGRAFEFDGTVHIRVPDAVPLKPERLTLETWVFPTVLSGNSQAIAAKGFSNSNDDTWYLGLLGSIPQFWSHGNRLLECPFAIPQNQWTHLAITFDGLVKRLYVNGVQAASQNEPAVLVYDAAPVPVTIGSDWAFNTNIAPFFGRIDEVALYDRALTEDEILGIYKADFAGKNFSQPYFTSPARLPDAALGASYTQPLTTILGMSPISFSLPEGTLPPGLTLSSAGVVSGIATAAGTYDFTVLATDATGVSTKQLCVLRVV